MELSETYNKVLELEGLVLLLQKQESDASKKDVIIRQIQNKLDEISSLIETYGEDVSGNECQEQNPAVEFAGEDLEQAVKDAEADIMAVEESIHEEIEDVATAEALNAIAKEEEGTGEEAAEPAKPENDADPNYGISISEEKVEKVDKEIPKPDSDINPKSDINIIIDCNGIDVNKSAFAHKTSGDIRKAFTLNDNYKFRRQLFNNSQQEYAQALSEIERMNSLAEVEDYVYDKLQLDKDNQDVKDFMDIISAYLSGK